MKGLVALSKCVWITYPRLSHIEKVALPEFEPATHRSRNQHANHSANVPNSFVLIWYIWGLSDLSSIINTCMIKSLYFVSTYNYLTMFYHNHEGLSKMYSTNRTVNWNYLRWLTVSLTDLIRGNTTRSQFYYSMSTNKLLTHSKLLSQIIPAIRIHGFGPTCSAAGSGWASAAAAGTSAIWNSKQMFFFHI